MQRGSTPFCYSSAPPWVLRKIHAPHQPWQVSCTDILTCGFVIMSFPGCRHYSKAFPYLNPPFESFPKPFFGILSVMDNLHTFGVISGRGGGDNGGSEPNFVNKGEWLSCEMLLGWNKCCTLKAIDGVCCLVHKWTRRATPRQGLSKSHQILNLLKKGIWRTVLICMDKSWDCLRLDRF